MPYKIKKEMKGVGVVITFSGIVEADEIDKLQNTINSDESFPQLRYQIWDFSKSEEINITFDQIEHFAMQTAVAASKNPKQRIAIIPRKTSHNVLGKTFHSFEKVWGSTQSKSFIDINDAKDWCRGGKS